MSVPVVSEPFSREFPSKIKSAIIDAIAWDDQVQGQAAKRAQQKQLSALALLWPDTIHRIRQHRFRELVLSDQWSIDSFVACVADASTIKACVRTLRILGSHTYFLSEMQKNWATGLPNATTLVLEEADIYIETLLFLGYLNVSWCRHLREIRIINHESFLESSHPFGAIELPLLLEHLDISIFVGAYLSKPEEAHYIGFWRETLLHRSRGTARCIPVLTLRIAFISSEINTIVNTRTHISHVASFDKVIGSPALGVKHLRWGLFPRNKWGATDVTDRLGQRAYESIFPSINARKVQGHKYISYKLVTPPAIPLPRILPLTAMTDEHRHIPTTRTLPVEIKIRILEWLGAIHKDPDAFYTMAESRGDPFAAIVFVWPDIIPWVREKRFHAVDLDERIPIFIDLCERVPALASAVRHVEIDSRCRALAKPRSDEPTELRRVLNLLPNIEDVFIWYIQSIPRSNFPSAFTIISCFPTTITTAHLHFTDSQTRAQLLRILRCFPNIKMLEMLNMDALNVDVLTGSMRSPPVIPSLETLIIRAKAADISNMLELLVETSVFPGVKFLTLEGMSISAPFLRALGNACVLWSQTLRELVFKDALEVSSDLSGMSDTIALPASLSHLALELSSSPCPGHAAYSSFWERALESHRMENRTLQSMSVLFSIHWPYIRYTSLASLKALDALIASPGMGLKHLEWVALAELDYAAREGDDADAANEGAEEEETGINDVFEWVNWQVFPILTERFLMEDSHELFGTTCAMVEEWVT
ncbi:hypothetical protein CYLTODRAFT_442231 [Cylindrobasidium torrendii FP15055 ss-10]|uniref:Uncharacterized protein n=1 Tax=Cylindrobasidium torrendii FP15055 ss-10 TaxID=1314674 RepID=A0A0D7BIR5_9AGAR|nr:hypothetical protein CYLTODRAFT_442231 [Cylindrobasidium torrendii FP15055 ss-10]